MDKKNGGIYILGNYRLMQSSNATTNRLYAYYTVKAKIISSSKKKKKNIFIIYYEKKFNWPFSLPHMMAN